MIESDLYQSRRRTLRRIPSLVAAAVRPPEMGGRREVGYGVGQALASTLAWFWVGLLREPVVGRTGFNLQI